MKYDFKKIESKWQKKWLEEKVFKAKEKPGKNKYYQLETFPYPSAAGLHVGHPKGYIAEDIHARYMRMNGKDVLYTMGWDAFGLPTENYAIKVKKNPSVVARENIDNFRRQLQMFGFSYDWDREINTASPEYYKWTQWLFIQLFKKGLAYRKTARVNWCSSCQTVLANEQVVEGVCERCKTVIEQREMEQWFFKITDYVKPLLKDLKGLDWPTSTIKRQRDWIGKSEGAEIDFLIREPELKITVFTTRPDTLFGATYLVLAPEHSLINELKSKIKNWKGVEKYIKETEAKTELMRREDRAKTGIELKGVTVINPATQKEIPVWISDYVLMGYGTGSIMAVPGHDERDFQFAKKFDLPIKKVVVPKPLKEELINAEDVAVGAQSELRIESDCWIGEGEMINSGTFNGMDSKKARKEITAFVHGVHKTQYKIRDWSVSRQRYWGVPIPIIECDACGIVPVPEKDLPVTLPELDDYRPKGMPPLASSKKFINVKCPECKGNAKRAAETLDTFVDSSWYFLRYTDPHNKKEFAGKNKLKAWMPVDLYVIGEEHTTLHLLYSRFITKFLHDEGYLAFSEPFLKLRHLGLIQGSDGQKMSKSRGNVVNPDELVDEFGADSVRLYEMFMGPFENGQPWNPKGVVGTHRFLARVWKLNERIKNPKDWNDRKISKEEKRFWNQSIKKITEDIQGFKFNTAVAQFMIMLNDMEAGRGGLSTKFEIFLKLFYPFAPHIAQELWEQLGNTTFLDNEKWPQYNEKLIKEDSFELVIQVNGKLRETVKVSVGITQNEAEKIALESEKIQKILNGKKPKKIIFVPDKLINFVL